MSSRWQIWYKSYIFSTKKKKNIYICYCFCIITNVTRLLSKRERGLGLVKNMIEKMSNLLKNLSNFQNVQLYIANWAKCQQFILFLVNNLKILITISRRVKVQSSSGADIFFFKSTYTDKKKLIFFFYRLSYGSQIGRFVSLLAQRNYGIFQPLINQHNF